MTPIFLFPGQGSQKKGMGADAFPLFADEVAAADRILGYSVVEQCLEDPGERLIQTQFTQPLLFVVSSLMHLARTRDGLSPAMVAGHSVGEFAALFAAGVFDFETGLRIVQKRGELMSRATGGGMAAVVGLSADDVRNVLKEAGHDRVDLANLNSPRQSVISGLKDDVLACRAAFETAGARFIPLEVSGAFHSRCMASAQGEFESFVRGYSFNEPKIPVIANVTARPYEPGAVIEMITRQITSPVRWVESMQYALQQPEPTFEEVGPGSVLTGLLRQIRKAGS